MRDKLEIYYNKFNEDKRLKRRHGNVEFQVTFSYILKYLNQYKMKRLTKLESSFDDKNNGQLKNSKVLENLTSSTLNIEKLAELNGSSIGKSNNHPQDAKALESLNGSALNSENCNLEELNINQTDKTPLENPLNQNTPKYALFTNNPIKTQSHNNLIEFENFEILDEEKRLNSQIKIADIGAGTGRYSIPLHNLGFDVLAVEPFKCNLNKLTENDPNIPSMLGDARNLKKLADNSFDLTLLFGPMYHLGSVEEKVKALSEAERITKPNGIIMVAYITNEYSVITHAFKSHKFSECKENGKLSANFKTIYTESDLYSFSTLEDIDSLISKFPNLNRINIFGADGPAEYMRREINEMDETEYNAFIQFVKQIAERKDLLGASAHIVDVLKKI